MTKSISELELSVRASNCLEAAKVDTVGQLARLTESELLRIRSFGKTSLREVKRKLADLNLQLGMSVELAAAAEPADEPIGEEDLGGGEL